MTRKSFSWMAWVLLVTLLALSVTGCNRSAAGDDVAKLEEQMIQEAAQNTTPEPTPQETAVVEPGTPAETAQPTAETPPAATEQPVVETPTATPVAVTEAPAVVATPVVTTAPGTHVVQAGENLFRIALRYGVAVDALAQANNITSATFIYVGQVLTIPGGSSTPPSITEPKIPDSGATIHVVQPGENLFRIALRYGLDFTYLAQFNGITDPSMVYVGQQIKIPAR